MNTINSNDIFIKKKEILNYIKIGETKLNELIRTGKLIEPVIIDGFKEPLYSLEELKEWMQKQLEKRKTLSSKTLRD